MGGFFFHSYKKNVFFYMFFFFSFYMFYRLCGNRCMQEMSRMPHSSIILFEQKTLAFLSHIILRTKNELSNACDPTAGSLTAELKEVCRKFEEVTSMSIQVQERAGNALKHLAKSEPLKKKTCNRKDYFICTTNEAGQCTVGKSS